MATTRGEGADQERVFELRPNAGVYWKQTLAIFIALSVVCLGIAIAFTAAGFWPILPFAGLEIAALGAALYISARRGQYREVIRVRAREVVIEAGWREPEEVRSLPRFWCTVELRPSARRWYPARLVLRSGSDEVECGSFLTDEERSSLAEELRASIGPMASGGSGSDQSA